MMDWPSVGTENVPPRHALIIIQNSIKAQKEHNSTNGYMNIERGHGYGGKKGDVHEKGQ
jgi:hypothetical protein